MAKLLCIVLFQGQHRSSVNAVCRQVDVTPILCMLQLFLLLSASQAFLLNLCIFWCTTVNSPLATTVTGASHVMLRIHARSVSRHVDRICEPGTQLVCDDPAEGHTLPCAGQMKDILTTGLGMFIFGDVTFEPKNVIGVSVGLTGGILYAYFSYRDSQQRAAVSAPPLCNSLTRQNNLILTALQHMSMPCLNRVNPLSRGGGGGGGSASDQPGVAGRDVI